MELYIDIKTATWGSTADLRLVSTQINLDEVLDTLSDSEIIDAGFAGGREPDTCFLQPNSIESEQVYLVCKNCGEAFATMQTALEHGIFIPGPDPSWCGEDGFDLVPESDAL